ncbi:hypothetical protein SAMN05444161_0486 [Rhizobiales bacterium GAS191]|jgi:hypothetical protein|nr:hypothetical protein SAMN05519103_07975 [Rhizobiales bacterium GAS113]SEC09095.1 hypothetical protein SAMN05444161_0486 [Rhizobiales bacterium GAS191]SED10985.1 hypothetical protein SAMN05519104_2815 [Rhizobiales bacterium GAS188]
MQLFECGFCRQPLYFENDHCESCLHRLGYVAETMELVPLQASDRAFAVAGAPERRYRFCANAVHGVCNWLIAAEESEDFCLACRHNRTIPALANPENRRRWRLVEQAKHRLFYTLMELHLPLRTRAQDPAEGLVFDFLDDEAQSAPRVLTGHEHGLITLNIAEADDAERERRRHSMGEAYRTLLGHFRHEIGHYYWDRLVRDRSAMRARFRDVFGDELADYEGALRSHYAGGAPPDWRESFVTAYASAHPWEDFAESFAHYLHIVDTLETATAFGLSLHPRIARGAELSADVDFDPNRSNTIASLMQAWLPLTFAVNSLNRGMGQPDLYPFVLSPVVVGKLGFIHDLVHGSLTPHGEERSDFRPAMLDPEPA